ncbi:hypothetical protein DSM106972_032670 [Dulcicalothrix desertica PCC 7102]|uniref:Uncharacterized protein n=1 Tax=Dulcicalothrix desertica PCC 7102 TaxID=232991 RepID=A0A433VIX4_9CYAN|nr:hypothetical protein [Dulcicalothrix desertica]RUT06061.1 hypothetical protein DSM106972_032670 [Dulcicalothrix desertica PCC 7102]TWH54272.1 hypothetical protein CAL7102_02291 [Dulcicalothrix desertica PCC 7102]
MNLDYNQILAESSCITTHSQRLDEIYNSLKDFPKARKNQIVEAIGLNPNTNPDTIKSIFQRYGGMADQIIQHNPFIPLLQLSKPEIFKDWILERSHPIFYNVKTSLLLQEIALSTKNTTVNANLANSKDVDEKIIKAIAKKTSFSANIKYEKEELRLRQELIKNQHTPVKILLNIVQKQNETQFHENAWININSFQHKKQEVINYFKSLNTPKKTWAENLVGKIEALLEKAKLEGALDKGKDGYQSFVYEEYIIETLPLAGIKVLYNNTYYNKKLIFNYDIESLQVFVSVPSDDEIEFWNNVS